jgi:hypothetical protein
VNDGRCRAYRATLKINRTREMLARTGLLVDPAAARGTASMGIHIRNVEIVKAEPELPVIGPGAIRCTC